MTEKRNKLFVVLLVLALVFALAPQTRSQKPALPAPLPDGHVLILPPIPADAPGWLRITSKSTLRRFFVCGTNGYADNHPALANDLLVGDMCHAMIEEQMATGKLDQLETTLYPQLTTMLQNPAPVAADQHTLTLMDTYPYKYSSLGRQYRLTELVDSEAHEAIMKIVSTLDTPPVSSLSKDVTIRRLLGDYFPLPGAITSLPMNMANLEHLPYYGAFRRKCPNANNVMWGYHWMSNSTFDLLYGKTLAQQQDAYVVIGAQYRETELWRKSRPVMPMVAETSPAFATKFPQVANMVDNFHMMHDLIADVLATDTFSADEKDEEIKRIVWLFSAAAHEGEAPGDTRSGDPLHDHRFIAGMPGLGMMRGATPTLMYMPRLGWMSLGDCHHCSMPLAAGDDAWRTCRVSADGWTMRVRCALCARDMAAETKGRAVLQIATEDADRSLVLVSDDQGNFTTDMPDVVFLEVEGSHTGCSQWSQAFTSRTAFDGYVKLHQEFKDAKALTLSQWSARVGKKPDTYVKPKGPASNPYQLTPATRKISNADTKRLCCQK